MSLVIDVGNVVTLRLNYADFMGNKAFNLLHYRLKDVVVAGGGLFPGEQASTVLLDLMTEAQLNLPGAWAAAANQNVAMIGMTAQSILPAPRSRAYTRTFEVAVQGEVPGDMLPLQDSPTIVKRTAVGARHGIGRLFFVGVAESNQSNGLVDGGWMTTANNFCAQLQEDLVFAIGAYTYTFEPVIHGRISGPPPVTHTTPIESVSISDNIIKTQRRRRPGKGI